MERAARVPGCEEQRASLIAIDRREVPGVRRGPSGRDEIRARDERTPFEQRGREAAPVDGEDIMRVRQLAPGPEVGRIKQRLTELVMDGVIEPSREAVLAYLESHPTV